MQPMVLEDLPTFAQTKSPSYVGKYIIHRAYGIYIYYVPKQMKTFRGNKGVFFEQRLGMRGVFWFK